MRSFYQHFSTKDELLLALIDKIMAESTQRWRTDTAALPGPEALRVLIEKITAPASSSTQDSINRGLTYYNDHLAESLPREYARVLAPLHDLIRDIVRRGMADGDFEPSVEVDPTSALILQSVLGAMRLRALGVELNGAPIEGPHIFDFCIRSLSNPGHPR